ncbi:hypothetical protein [Methylobacterium sp. Leaf85]|uniref:hypothetical protein n=1 Tax=Methylobacterium sp. Leaf85 TaxID=1736241 RepID=UPI000700052A|nr:hypothetical protein [Methylobacterium sp. Leaf85]KQO49945.1 hypothetical protein ASF08_22670 [Methylobacterium sp. Leaf85]
MMLYLLRPTPGMTNPPLCTLHELRTIYTLDDLANMHELIDLQDAQSAKAASIRKKEIDASRRKTR